MNTQLQPETPDLFPELIPTKPFGLTFIPSDFTGPYSAEKKEMGFFRLVSSTGRIIASVRERIPLMTLNILVNAWDVMRAIEYVQNDIQIILNDLEAVNIRTYQEVKDSVDPLLSVVRKTKSKVVVSAFPNGGADSTTKVYDLSDYAGPYQEMESSAGWIDIASAKDIIIASISDMIPVSVRQNLLNSWGNFRTLMSIEERLLSLLSDVECGSVHGDQLSGELVCLLADIIAGSEMQHA